MAQTFAYSYRYHFPLPKGYADETTPGQSLFCISVSGPASSLQAGNTIASVSTDLTYISALWEAESGNAAYKLRFTNGAANLASSGVIIVDRCSTGTALSDDVDLSSVGFRLMGIGTGPFASAVD